MPNIFLYPITKLKIPFLYFTRSVRELQMTSKTDVFAFGVVLAELITGLRAVIRDNREPNKMKSLISVVSHQISIR